MPTDLEHDVVKAEPGAGGSAAPDAEPGYRYLNRELSWLDYAARVLAIAEDRKVPLLERARFLAILSEGLDEFFQVRVATLKDQLAARVAPTSPDGLTPAEQLGGRCLSPQLAADDGRTHAKMQVSRLAASAANAIISGLLGAIRDRTEELVKRQTAVFMGDIVPDLAAVGVVLSDWETLDDDDREYLVKVFEERIYPVLTPLAVDPGHPFPYISNLSLNLAVSVRDPATGERGFARLKVPPLLPRFVVMPDGERFVALEQVIAAHLGALFPGMEIESQSAFRVTRNTDTTLVEEEADDLLEAVELELRRRRFGRAVRLEIDSRTSDHVRELLCRELDLEPEDVYVIEGPLQLGGLWAVCDLDRPELKFDTWGGVTQPRLVEADGVPCDIFAVIREQDVLVHHPYDSFATSVEAFIEQAAGDPKVLAIKQTLYRTSGDSPVVKALIHAAEQGKQVAALVELKARFDEMANIAWARALEEAGVHVVYGLVGLKTHAKTALVVRDEPDGIRRYCHIGTGNYNPKTARLYEDLGLLTCDPDIGADATELFNYLTGYSRKNRYRTLMVAPVSLRAQIIDLIARERDAGPEGRVVLKMNNLVDSAMIDSLYEASRAGVEIDLIVRSICCLRAGVPGLSETIRVRSIVGRYLEHSRIFTFGPPDRRQYYLGSADLMPRNLDRRVEAVVPVQHPELQARLQEVLDVNLADDTLAWELGRDGVWHKAVAEGGVSTQARLQELAYERARRRRISERPTTDLRG